MLDLRVLRDNFKTVADALKKRGKQIELDAVMKLDEERRAMMTKVEELKAMPYNSSFKHNARLLYSKTKVNATLFSHSPLILTDILSFIADFVASISAFAVSSSFTVKP